ncbi:FG-GAP-like repeat-containing protein [Planotetraspora thailandica]|uniref:FG-GAP-like repeat-containing protein n=1 Tax=Planotetraspora thailandica TaxID=487172 RepID=UPI0035EBE8BD
MGPFTHAPAEFPYRRRLRGARLVVRALTAGLAFAAVAAPLAASAPTAQAAAPASQEIVITTPVRATPRADKPLAGGTTGFLHQQEGLDGYTWTDYASGASKQVPGLRTLPSGTFVRPVGAGGDLLVLYPSPALGEGAYTVLDPHTGALREMPVPAGYVVRGTVAGKVMALRTGLDAGGLLLGIDPGSTQSSAFTGLPTDSMLLSLAVQPHAADDRGALISYKQAGQYRFGLLDPATAAVTPIPAMTSSRADLRVMLTADRVLWWAPGVPTLHWMPRADVSAQVRDLALPSDSNPVAAIGDTFLVVRAAVSDTTLGPRVTALPLDGGEPSTVLDHIASVSTLALFAADDSTVFVGGSGVGDWAAHRVTAGSDGALSVKAVLPLPSVGTDVRGLNLYRGTLNRVDEILGKLSLYQQDVGIAAVPIAGTAKPLSAGMPASTVRCAAGEDCVRVVEGNSYGHAFLSEADGKTYLETRVDSYTSHTQTQLPGSGGQVLDASRDYVVVDGASPKTQYLVVPGTGKVIRSRPVQAAALWYSTLWSTSTSAPGTLTAETLTLSASSPGKPIRTVTTGAACVPTELQASARWLYWSCGDGEQAGVYDLTNNRGFAVPSGQAMLGDGYVVRHDRTAGELKLTDFHTGAPAAERTVGDLPGSGLPDDRRITWTVDKYSGHIAYVDDENRVHVLADGVPDSAPVIALADVSDVAEPRVSWYWSAYFYLSRPLDSWELTISHKITGRKVATLTGMAERGGNALTTFWNGREPNTVVPESGAYTWRLTAKYSGGTVPAQLGSGVLRVDCGRVPTHVYDCDARPDLLAVRSDGKLYSYEGQSNRTLRNAGFTAIWPTSSLLVPIGDLNGDLQADLLVRDSKGALRAYWGFGQVYFAKSTNKSTLIGTGWERYNVLTSPGDLTGDGRPDLVARDKSGVLWMYAADGKGKFKGRVKIASGQGGYTMMVGVGDINGDGRGDMLGRDKSGYLWRWYGNGKGTFGGRVRLAAGWNAYNAVVGIGDLTQDGKADLLSRDTKGNLYRWTGTGKGTFISRVKLATGWNVYKSLV